MIFPAKYDLVEHESHFETTMGGLWEACRSMGKVREIYERWLDGDLSQEDALFAIGDLLDEESKSGPAAEHGPGDHPIVVAESV